MNLISRFVRDESGATAIEYGLIAALIAVVIITAVTAVGTHCRRPSPPSRHKSCKTGGIRCRERPPLKRRPFVFYEAPMP